MKNHHHHWRSFVGNKGVSIQGEGRKMEFDILYLRERECYECNKGDFIDEKGVRNTYYSENGEIMTTKLALT